jgi:hypothetical protein
MVKVVQFKVSCHTNEGGGNSVFLGLTKDMLYRYQFKKISIKFESQNHIDADKQRPVRPAAKTKMS